MTDITIPKDGPPSFFYIITWSDRVKIRKASWGPSADPPAQKDITQKSQLCIQRPTPKIPHINRSDITRRCLIICLESMLNCVGRDTGKLLEIFSVLIKVDRTKSIDQLLTIALLESSGEQTALYRRSDMHTIMFTQCRAALLVARGGY